MQIQNESLVTIAVRMFDLQGNLIEETEEGGVTYLHGHDDIFAALEKKLEGHEAGETVTAVIEPEDAFGEYDADAIFLVPVDQLGDPELIVPGLMFDEVPGVVNDGRKYRVSEIAEGMAVMDGNHPLAGWTLRFDVSILKVEESDEDQEVTGNDDVVVPGFLGLADSIIDEGDDDEAEEEAMRRAVAAAPGAASEEEAACGHKAASPASFFGVPLTKKTVH